MSKLKCSIIIPTFERHSLLLKAMASCAKQNYPHDQFEVIVVNDGGRGTNRKNVRARWKSPAPLKYSRIEHRGLSAAINHGIRKANGEYFTIVPDDDAILPNKLRIMCDFLDARPQVDVAYSLPKYIDQKGNAVPTPEKLRTFLKAHPVLTWKHIQDGHGLWVHGTGTMYRKSVTDNVGFWDEKLPTSEEYEWHLRLLHGGHDFHAIDAITTLYRVHGGSKSNEYRQRRKEFRSYIASKFKKPHKKNEPSEPSS